MLKIDCPECKKSFIWTDDMPFKGDCPNPDCEGRYDIHRSLKQSARKRTSNREKICLCPACGGEVASRWALCKHCGSLVAGARSFRRRDLLLAVVLLLLALSSFIRYMGKP
ncbi:MAG: hypothetical protein M0009_03070 [Deltaproteobacteria bacterium]|nr:hypothetical protein [Deltaproteobacteria bacterium]